EFVVGDQGEANTETRAERPERSTVRWRPKVADSGNGKFRLRAAVSGVAPAVYSGVRPLRSGCRAVSVCDLLVVYSGLPCPRARVGGTNRRRIRSLRPHRRPGE